MNGAMRFMHRTRMELLLGALLFVSGCAGYPLSMTAKEWKALTPEQQAEAYERQKKIDQYDADVRVCRGEAERKAVVKFPVGRTGGSLSGVSGRQGEMEISLGLDWEFYRRCMERAGWEMSPFMERIRPGSGGR